jgi:hypothetical protein
MIARTANERDGSAGKARGDPRGWVVPNRRSELAGGEGMLCERRGGR